MALAIWIAARVGHAIEFLRSWPFSLVVVGLFAAASVCIVVRVARRASLADLRPGAILYAWFLVRFTFLPAMALLALFWLIAWALGLGVAVTLGNAARLTVMIGIALILLTSILADLALVMKGPGREPPSAS